MFDGLAAGDDHHHHHEFHQFIASSRAASLLHGNPPSFSAPPPFDDDPYQQLIPNTKTTDDNNNNLFSTTANLAQLEEEMVPSWSSDEVGALLKLRSAMEISSFPANFTWEHVSRKLGEMGFKRSPEECKRKYAEEEKHSHFTTPSSFTKNYKIFSELDELYPNTHSKLGMDQDEQLHTNNYKNDDNKPTIRKNQKREEEEEEEEEEQEEEERFEMLKGFVEGMVGKMMAQQEEMHNKLIEDMVRRDEEKVARELAWKRQEMERIQTQIEMRAKQTANAGARQATMIKFLKAINNTSSSGSTNPNPITSPPSPNSKTPSSGKRWPRDEIVALINLRCKINNEEAGSSNKQQRPLWERISAGMVELGHKRSAKRCKEKWENINKYFRKTRDSNKKRSVDSRTCPYFHHLTCLYTQGTLLPPNSTD